MNIGIYIYDQAEVLDFSGPFEVFTTASRVCPEEEPFKVYRVNPACGFKNHPRIDLLLVVGGYHYDEMKKVHVLKWIKDQADQAQYVASVCSGTWLLAEAGVLTNQNVTTHWEDISALQASYPNLRVHENVRWIDEGRIATSAGISAGIDMSLHLVSKLHSLKLAEQTARQMEYAWEKNERSIHKDI